MTDKEIVQALRQCAKRDCSSCGVCPIFPDRECVEHLAAAAASLIERLTAENAALKRRFGKLAACFVRGFGIARKGLSRPTKKTAIIARRNRIARA